MGLKAFFIIRFVAIGFIVALSYYLLHYILLITSAYQQPLWFLTSGISTILLMISAYKQLQHEPAESKEIIHTPDEVDFNNPKHLERLRTPHASDGKLGATELREVSSKYLSLPSKPNNLGPHTPTKRDMERAIKRRTLQEIKDGKINVKVVMERDREGKWDITEAKSTIETDDEAPKPSKTPTTLRPLRTRSG